MLLAQTEQAMARCLLSGFYVVIACMQAITTFVDSYSYTCQDFGMWLYSEAVIQHGKVCYVYQDKP